MAGPNISVAVMSDISALNIVEKLRAGQTDQLKTDGSIRIGSETYKVSYVRGEDGSEKLQMKRNYTGFLIGPLLNLFNRNKLATQPRAVQLTNTVNEMMKSGEYKFVRNTYDKLMEIADKFNADDNGVIEVGHYGHSEPRKKVVELGIVEAVNRSIANTGKTIHLNKIDTYNTFLGITTESMLPCDYGKLMENIANNKLQPNTRLMNHEQYSHLTVDEQDLSKWQAYIAKPEIANKIDIPKKLFGYLHPPQGQDDKELVGWAKDFKNNPNTALRHFVIKNLSEKIANSGYVDEKMLTDLCDKLRQFVEAYSETDPAARDKKMAEFHDPHNWTYTESDMKKLNSKIQEGLKSWCAKNGKDFDEVKGNAEAKKKYRAHWLKHNPIDAVKQSTHYKIFANILTYSTFRQTSKIGLDFFKSENKPVLFHMSHRDLTDFGDNTQWITNENHWKDGEGHFDEKYGGSEITHSEVRHADKLIKEFGEDANIWKVQGS